MTRPDLVHARRGLRCVLLGAGFFAALSVPLPARAAAPDTQRIVSLGGAVTEILDALGADDRIAAIDTTSTYPPELVRTKPSVGYLRQLSAEGILSVNPSLVIAVDGAGPPDALRLVREAGIPVDSVADEPSPAGIRHKIEAIAKLIGEDAKGVQLAHDVDSQFAALAAARSRLEHRDRVLFILSAQSGRMMVGGRGTSAAGVLELAGAENAAAAIEGYKPMSGEAIIAAQPDAILMMQAGPDGAPNTGLLDGPALSQTPAGRAKRLIVMDGSYLLGFGPRTPEAARDLMNALYPGQRSE
jgi:iron complex transport system substrate-binding protein